MTARELLAFALSPDVHAALEKRMDEKIDARLAELVPSGPEYLTLKQMAELYPPTEGALRARAQRGSLPGSVKDEVDGWLVHRPTYDAALLATLNSHPKNKWGGTAPTARPRHRRYSSDAI